jgi:hypothetical protein
MAHDMLTAVESPPDGATKKSPFVIRQATCPVCGRQAAQRDLRAATYLEEAWDSDHRVARYRWLDPEFAHLHPPHYALWHCPSCLFTDFKDDFRNPPATSDRFRQLRLLILRRLKDQDAVLLALGGAIDVEEMSFETALTTHLLALYLQELPAEEHRDPHKIGRLALRTAWLYRERYGETKALDARLRALISVRQDLGRVLDDVGELVMVVHRVEETLPRAIGEGSETPALDPAEVIRLRERLTGLADEAKRLSGLCVGTDLDAAGLRDQRPFRDFPSYPAFLDAIAELWPSLPRQESECLLRAALAYERYYESERGPAGTGLGTLDLIIDLHRRLGNWAQMAKSAGQLVRRASEERRLLQADLVRPEVSDFEKRRLRAKMSSLGDLAARGGELAEEAERHLHEATADASK